MLFNNDVRVRNDSLKNWNSAGIRSCVQIVQQQRQANVQCCEAVGVLAAVGVFADAGQQNLVEWLKGVRRYELSGCLRQAVVRSNEPGGAMQ